MVDRPTDPTQSHTHQQTHEYEGQGTSEDNPLVTEEVYDQFKRYVMQQVRVYCMCVCFVHTCGACYVYVYVYVDRWTHTNSMFFWGGGYTYTPTTQKN